MKIQRQILKIEPVSINCGYCSSYAEGRYNKNASASTEDRIIKQFCAKDRQVESNDNACQLFLMHPFFYCRKNNQRLDISICIARQNKRREGCVKCYQGKILKTYLSAKEVCDEE